MISFNKLELGIVMLGAGSLLQICETNPYFFWGWSPNLFQFIMNHPRGWTFFQVFSWLSWSSKVFSWFFRVIAWFLKFWNLRYFHGLQSFSSCFSRCFMVFKVLEKKKRKKRPNCIWTTNANPSIEPRNDNDDISLQRRMGVCESHTGAVWQLGRHIKLLTPEAFSRQLIQDFLSFFCPFPLICLFSSVNPRFPTISCDPILWILTILTS